MAKGKTEAAEVSKMDMVRQAIDVLGADAKPKQLQQHIKGEHGVEIGTTMISSYKSSIGRKQGGAIGGGRGIAGDATVGVRDLSALRDLIDRVGAPQLQALIKVLAR
ncbi:MAG: hypothetical protein U0871_18830 [Gemmataceae bacterium]